MVCSGSHAKFKTMNFTTPGLNAYGVIESEEPQPVSEEFWFGAAFMASLAFFTAAYCDGEALAGLAMALPTRLSPNLVKASSSLKRRMGHLPITTLTLLPGDGDTPKVIVATNGRDNIGLAPFASAFELAPLGEEDVMVIEANGVPQETIDRVVAPYILAGYRPVGTRMLIRCYDEQGNEMVGAEYIRAIEATLGSFVNVRSYFSLAGAPALRQFEVPVEGLTTERSEGSKQILWFIGKAQEIYPALAGTEGGMPISPGAMEAIYGSRKPGQPRMVLKLSQSEAVLFKGNHTILDARAFEDGEGGHYFLCRGEVNDESFWETGHDFVFLEDDCPKGNFKSQVQLEDGCKAIEVAGRMSGWLIAEANDKQGSSLVSYQVLALLAQGLGLNALADAIKALVEESVARSVALASRDLQELNLDPSLSEDLEALKQHLAATAPASAKQGRKNHFGFGASMSTGYVHMNTLFNRGIMVVGDSFGLTRGQVKRDAKKGQPVGENVCGGKNPILDHQQIFVGNAYRLSTLKRMLEAIKRGEAVDTSILFGDLPVLQAKARLNWIIAHEPALKRGSILMNAEDVADLAGDDDGDQLWFSFRDELVLKIFQEVKAQAAGNTCYSIENDKSAQQPSEVGNLNFSEILSQDEERVREMARFIMAPNKGQGPVGYLANLCTVLVTFFEKVDNGSGGLKFENPWVERLQAILNLMQQTSIDMQKRIFLTPCLYRWSAAKIEKKDRGLVPGFDFPGLGVEFDMEGFDPSDFTKEQYHAAISNAEMPEIPHHYTGLMQQACRDTDSQYNISALGSWLIWECISLVATGLPCAWPGAAVKGGLDPLTLARSLENGESLVEILDLNDEVKAAVEQLWVEKPRELYGWKTQSKGQNFTVAAPPALKLNHKAALEAKRSHLPDGPCPGFKVQKILTAVREHFSVIITEQSLKHFVASALDGFYLEAAMAYQAKSTSEKMQAADQRSGIESLRFLIESLETFSRENKALEKLALGIADAVNPRIECNAKDAKIGLTAMIFAWYQEVHAGKWAFDYLASRVEAMAADGEQTKTSAWESFGFTKQQARSAVRGQRSTLRRDPEFLLACESIVFDLDEARAEKLKARATWFIDEGLPAMVKAVERQEIIATKRDILKSLGETARIWTNERSEWSNEELCLEIFAATFLAGDALWCEPLRQKLKAMGTPKASMALKILDNKGVDSIDRIDALCHPASNPLAKQFTAALLDNCGPVVNLERAWRRATEWERDHTQAWTRELGDWVKVTKKDPETGRKTKVSRFYAYSRIEWELGTQITAGLTRTLLEAGVSIYKLTKVPGRSNQTWRLFDAFVNAAEPLSDWQLVNGLGHLVSMAVPVQKQDDESASRLAHVGLLEEALELCNQVLGDQGLSIGDRSFFEDERIGIKSELSRIEALESNGLMARWGHLWFPATWGMSLRTYPGQVSEKALNGRAQNAVIGFGANNPNIMKQPEYTEVGGQQVPVVSSLLKPYWDEVNKRVPFTQGAARRGLNKRYAAHMSSNQLGTENLVAFDWEGQCESRMSYSQWLDSIMELAIGEGASCKSLVASSLWFQGHVGRIWSLSPESELDQETRDKVAKKLTSCPSYEARLHIEALLKGEWVQPNYNALNQQSAMSFRRMLKVITGC
jgi:hypothetical protein